MSGLERMLEDQLQDGWISAEDVATVLEFRDFLRECGPDKRVTPEILIKYADLLRVPADKLAEARQVIAAQETKEKRDA